MSRHSIPGGDRAACLPCGRRLYVFHDSPWPECDGSRQFTHALTPMTPIRPLTKERPDEDVPTPLSEMQELAAA